MASYCPEYENIIKIKQECFEIMLAKKDKEIEQLRNEVWEDVQHQIRIKDANIVRLQGLLDTLAGDPGSTEPRGWIVNRPGESTD